MPETPQEFIWYAFNLAFFCVMWFIRKDVKGMRDEMKQNMRVNNWLRHMVIGMYSRCQYIHPDKPIFPMPEDPDSHS
jgi:hypothetical protein